MLPALDAAERGDVFITVTGNRGVVRGEHFERMKDGAVHRNAGHFDVEVRPRRAARAAAERRRGRAPARRAATCCDGRRINLLAEGRVVNLAAAAGPSGGGDGHLVRPPGARRRAARHARRRARSARSSGARTRSTTRSRASSSRRSASRSTTLTAEQRAYCPVGCADLPRALAWPARMKAMVLAAGLGTRLSRSRSSSRSRWCRCSTGP